MSTILDGFTQVHVTERELAHQTPCGPDGPQWEDCTSCSAIELLRASGHPAIPATLTEAERLRCAGLGTPEGGQGQATIIAGARSLYGVELGPILSGWDQLRAALTPGRVGSVQGTMAAFPAGSHWRRWDPAFAGPHNVTAWNLGRSGFYWWCDPLAPEGIGYEGEWIGAVNLFDYVNALPEAGHLVRPIVPDAVPTAHTFHIAAGVTTLYVASVTADVPPRIAAWRTVPWSGIASSAPCLAPVYLAGTSSGGATVAKITAGAPAIVGTYLRVGAQWGTTVTP